MLENLDPALALAGVVLVSLVAEYLIHWNAARALHERMRQRPMDKLTKKRSETFATSEEPDLRAHAVATAISLIVDSAKGPPPASPLANEDDALVNIVKAAGAAAAGSGQGPTAT